MTDNKNELMEALEAVEYCISIAKNPHIDDDIDDEDMAIWSSGSSSNQRITLKTLKVLRNTIISESAPDTIVIKRSDVQDIEDDFKDHDWYKHGQSLEKCMVSIEILNQINERKAALIDRALKGRTK